MVSIVTKRNCHVFLTGSGWMNRVHRVHRVSRVHGVQAFMGEYNPIMENQMEATSENEVETADL